MLLQHLLFPIFLFPLAAVSQLAVTDIISALEYLTQQAEWTNDDVEFLSDVLPSQSLQFQSPVQRPSLTMSDF